jgi:hypothetical protein
MVAQNIRMQCNRNIPEFIAGVIVLTSQDFFHQVSGGGNPAVSNFPIQ